jgi:HAD superfamily hydrolase (TIGR01459 family)
MGPPRVFGITALDPVPPNPYAGPVKNSAISPADGLAALAPSYAAILCDVWGVLHNGEEAWPDAVNALVRFRQGGGRVIMITNAPRRKRYVVQQMFDLGIPEEAFDDVVTSGDAARQVLAQGGPKKLFHVGTDVHLPLYEGLPVELVDEESCDVISCTALFDDENETPDDYADRLARWRERDVPMLCVNPDIVVNRGGRMIWCAGSLAQRFEELGGVTQIVGKPYAPVYQTAFQRLSAVGGRVFQPREVLAIGDGVETDLRGAAGNGLDAVFISGGVHAQEFMRSGESETRAAAKFIAKAGLDAVAIMPTLTW